MSVSAAPRLSGLERTLWPTVGLLAATLVLYEFSPLDLRLQDQLYDFTNRRWLVDARDPLWRVLFYTGPKQVIVVFGLALLVLALGPEGWRRKLGWARRGLWVAFLTLAFAPSLTAIGKEYSNVFCPSEIRRYGGDVRYVKLCEPFPADDRPARRGHCFPAGHCSGGFALLGLAWLRPTRRWRAGAIALGLGVGWIMGLYQMFKGAHYLSHTVTTMLLCWIVAVFGCRVLKADLGRLAPTADSK